MTDDHSSVEAVAKRLCAHFDEDWQQDGESWIAAAIAAMPTPSDHSGAEAARETIRDALLDSQYLAGAKAGWNAAQDSDPEAAFRAIQQAYAGHLAGLKEAKATLANATPFDQDKLVARGEAIREVVGLCNRIPGSTQWNAAEFMYDLLTRARQSGSAEQ